MEVTKSAWSEMTIIKVLLCWLIVPVIIAIVVARNYRVRIDPKTIKVSSGVFNKREQVNAVAGATEINVNKSFWGGIFNYGDITIYLAGNKQIHLNGIKNPDEVRNYFYSKIQKAADASHIMVN